jgi:hypothetical protein
MLSLLVAAPTVQASANVESRITSVIVWIGEREVVSQFIRGFAAGPSLALNSTLHLRDQGLVALALSDFHSTHNDARYDQLLIDATEFIMKARTPTGKFYEYYDLQTQKWQNEGGLYPWEPYALAGLALSAYKISYKDAAQREYWTSVESKLKTSIVNQLSNQRSDGAWLFREKGSGGREALTAENGMMLAALSYIGLFEREYGNPQQALYYGKLSAKTAGWLMSMQISNSSLPGFGGFPHSDLNATQVSEENGIALFGVDSYYSIIDVLYPGASPSIWDARRVMIDWVAGFVREMRDSYGGPYFARNGSRMLEYPMTTIGACWMLQALADIWVNLGGDAYYADARKPYEWIVGGNALHADMQEPASGSGSAGFYAAIVSGNVDRVTRTDVAASAAYAFIRAAFVQIPELPQGAGALVLMLGLCATVLLLRRKPSFEVN